MDSFSDRISTEILDSLQRVNVKVSDDLATIILDDYNDVSMKRKAGVNFINVLREAFTRADSKSPIKTDGLTLFFCAFGIWVCKSCS